MRRGREGGGRERGKDGGRTRDGGREVETYGRWEREKEVERGLKKKGGRETARDGERKEGGREGGSYGE